MQLRTIAITVVGYPTPVRDVFVLPLNFEHLEWAMKHGTNVTQYGYTLSGSVCITVNILRTLTGFAGHLAASNSRGIRTMRQKNNGEAETFRIQKNQWLRQ